MLGARHDRKKVQNSQQPSAHLGVASEQEQIGKVLRHACNSDAYYCFAKPKCMEQGDGRRDALRL